MSLPLSVNYSRHLYWLLTILLWSTLVSAAQALPRGVTEITSVEGITEYRLKNGLKVLLFPDQSKETVTVNVTYKVGSKHENYGETGMAHLLEHLLFKGSKKHPNIPQELSEHGAQPNGTTWIDRTNYFETFAATEENIDWALSLESDRMVNSFIAKEDLDSEMTVVRNEFERSENSPFRVLMQRMMSVSYDWHNNGKPTIGARADIENVSIDKLQDFYHRYYQPDNAVLIIAGKFEPESMLKKVKKTFGKIAKPKRTLPTLYTEEPPQDGERLVTVRRVGDMKILASAYHIPAGTHPDYAAIEVLAQVMGDTPRGRLHKQVVEKDLAVSAFAFNFELQEPGLFFAAAQIEKEGDISKTRDVFFDVLESAQEHPITDEEVERAKANILKEIDLAFNSSERIAILLSEYIGMGDWRMLFLTRDRIEKVTSDDVQRVAQAYLQRNNRTEGRFYPTEAPERIAIPPASDVDVMLEGYTGREALASGEAFDPSFDNIQARSQLHTLSNGAKVALLPKKTRGESVRVHLSLEFGDLQSLMNKAFIADTAGDMLMRGSEKYSREEISDQNDRLKSSMSVSGNVDSASAQAETTRENLVPVIELIAEVLKNPSFDQGEFDRLITQQIASLEASRQEPQAIVGRQLYRYLSPHEAGHPHYRPTLDEQIAGLKAVDRKQLGDFHSAFYGGQQMQIAVVGDFDEAEVLNVLEKQFGQWRGKKAYQRIENPYVEQKPITKVTDTPDKENAALVAVQPLPIGEDHADAAALDVGTYILGGGFLNSRLAVRLRQQEGWSYSASAWLNLSDWDQRGELGAYAIFAPQNREAVKAGLYEEIKRLVDHGITEEELIAAKSGMLQSARVSRTENGTLARLWVGNLYYDRSMEWHKKRETEIQNLTVDDVNKALKKHIKVDQLSFITAADLSKPVAK